MRVRSAASPGSVPSTARGVFGGPGAALARRQMEVLLGACLRRPQATRDDGLVLGGDDVSPVLLDLEGGRDDVSPRAAPAARRPQGAAAAGGARAWAAAARCGEAPGTATRRMRRRRGDDGSARPRRPRGDGAATDPRGVNDTVADLRARRDMAESETRRRRGNETARARRRRQLRFGRGSHANLGQAAHLEDAARRFLPRDQI